MLREMTGEFPALSQVFVKERDMFLANSLKMAAKPIPNPNLEAGQNENTMQKYNWFKIINFNLKNNLCLHVQFIHGHHPTQYPENPETLYNLYYCDVPGSPCLSGSSSISGSSCFSGFMDSFLGFQGFPESRAGGVHRSYN